jgi:MoaA/NifB/PqqE/SkfB family radical SAM enzyme
MYTITDLHIELTDRCQASCPMCARNYNGGAERPFVGQHEITLDVFKQWFDQSWLSELKNFYACGNYGDPIIAKDCLEIFQYVRQVNPTARLSVHTNGSARSIDWWRELAKINTEVSFGIDGFESSHVLYRRGTSWQKIIENMTAFIDAGGQAVVDCLIFKHNEHEVTEFESYMNKLGVKKINFKYTSRFYNMASFPVQDLDGYIEYRLEPSTIKTTKINVDEISKDPETWANNKKIKPKCVDNREIYVDCRGNVFPCCWVGSDWVEEYITEKTELQTLRNRLIDNTRTKFKDLGIINLNNSNIREVHWRGLDKLWSESVPWVCAKNCNG